MTAAPLALAAVAALVGCAPAPAPVAVPAPAEDYVWWEAEAPAATNFPAARPFAPANDAERAVLSGGDWVSTDGKRAQTLFLEYDVAVPAAAAWQFYVRKFWKHGPFRWRFDDGPWQSVGNDPALLDDASLRQFVGANWIGAGEARLSAGKHRLRIELTASEGAAAFDCFVLTRAPFTARGKLKPGASWGRTEPGWFAHEPEPDPFRPTPLDLRRLNETQAGEGGFIARKGDALVHGKSGAPVRFWAVNVGYEQMRLPRASVDYLVRDLAKKGVNLVRVHGGLWREGGDFRTIDPEKLDALQYFVAALKKQGIYTAISLYFPLWLDIPSGDPIAGYRPGKKPFALLFFDPELQTAYRSWWKAALTTPNPYADGKPLAADPAVAFAELCNEDSYFFWTFTYENVPDPAMRRLEGRFGAWLARKYGSVAAALAAWKVGHPRDDAAGGRAGFRPLWELANVRDARSKDTARFLAEDQRAFFDTMGAYLKRDLGYKGLVYGSNWITADARVLGPLDKWSNAGLDLMDRHGYFEGKHEGPRASYSLSAGDRYEDRSALRLSDDNPSLPIFDLQWNGLPSSITEVNWPLPNRYRADFPLLASAYGALQGTDAVHLFALAGPGWQQSHTKFGLQSPAVWAQSPVAALIFRTGLVKTGPVVVQASLTADALFDLAGLPIAAPVNLDALRAADIPAGQTRPVAALPSIDPLAYLVGQVRAGVGEGATKPVLAHLPTYIDRERRSVRSATGELTWNWGAGRAVVNAPSVNAVVGFLADAGAVRLGAMTVTSPMEYGAVSLVALDGKPLSESRRMLLTAVSEDRNWGWKTDRATGVRTISDIGGAPILVRELAGTVALTRTDAGALKVTALDANGYPRGAAQTGAGRISLRPDTLYYLIEP